MPRVLGFALPIVLAVWCAVEVVQAEDSEVRHLPKMVWLIVVLAFPIVGPLTWLFAGRPRPLGRGWLSGGSTGPAGPGGPRRRGPSGPDDDPDFLKGL